MRKGKKENGKKRENRKNGKRWEKDSGKIEKEKEKSSGIPVMRRIGGKILKFPLK